jgi:hypothetical protein
VPGQVDIESAASHESQFVDVVKGIRHEAMVTYQHLKKRRKMSMPKGNLWANGEV